MKNIIIILLLALGVQVQAQTTEEKKTWVREHYEAIEDHLEDFTLKNYIYQPEEDQPPYSYFSFCLNAMDELVKATETMGEEGYSDVYSYYFKDGKLFFVFEESCEPNWDLEEFAQDCTETRTYLYNEEVFDCLLKFIPAMQDGDKIPNKKSEGDYKEITKTVLEGAKTIREYFLLSE